MIDFEKYMIAEESQFYDSLSKEDKKGLVKFGIGATLFTAFLIHTAIKKGRAVKEKNILTKRLKNLTPEEKESWNILITDYNPIFQKISSSMINDVKKFLGPVASKGIYPKNEVFPNTQKIESNGEYSCIVDSIFIYRYDFGRLDGVSDDEYDKIWDTKIEPFLSTAQEAIVEKYRAKYKKYSSIFDIAGAEMDHYGSVRIVLKYTDSLGVLKAGLKEP